MINFREWLQTELPLLLPKSAFSIPRATTSDVATGTDNEKLATSDALATLRGHGEVRLVLNGSNLQLNGFGGLGRLMVGGSQVQISNAGPTLATTGTANTTYHIYCYDAASPKLDASTAVPVYDASSGLIVKTGFPGQTYVGMARTSAAGAWVDTPAFRYVLSYFNRRQRSIYVALAVDKTPTTSNAEITAAAERAYFLTWADNPVVVGARVSCSHTSSSAGLFVMLGLDGTAITDSCVADAGYGTGGSVFANPIPPYPVDTTEGLHYIGLHAYNATSGYLSVIRGATSPGTAIQGTVWG